MDGKGCYCWNNTSNVYLGQWLERNRHGDGVYGIVTKLKTTEIKNKEAHRNIFKFICGKWKHDYVISKTQLKFIEAW